MFRLVLRQIFKQWKALLPIVLLWLIGGYFIFSDERTLYKRLYTALLHVDPSRIHEPPTKHEMLKHLSHLFTSLPGPGEERPEKAYFSYIRPALSRLEHPREGFLCRMLPSFLYTCNTPPIRIDLMTRACTEIPMLRPASEEYYRPHWLEKVKQWNIQVAPSDSGEPARTVLVEPVDYWKKYRDPVLSSLRDVVNGMDYAYEIPPGVQGEGATKTILVPELLAELSAAVCRPEIGIFAWGDYAQFLEVKAYRSMEKTGEVKNGFLYPDEKELLVLESLKDHASYLRALREYAGGGVVDPFDSFACGRGLRTLSCIAPEEALSVYNKILYFSGPEHRSSLYLDLGKLHAKLALRDGKNSEWEEALNDFTGASKSNDTEREAREYLARIYLRNRDYSSAYTQIQQLSLIMKNRGLTDARFRELARLTLIGLGRTKDADCFADLAESPYGMREHCRNFQL